VSPLGKKTYILYRKITGRPERITIGPCADLSIEQARKRAEEMNGAIALGANPAAKRRTVRDEMTLGELFETFLDSYAKQHKKSWKDDVGIFNLHLNGWRLRKISSIRKLDVVTLHSRIGRTRGQYCANRVVELLCSMFNRARSDWDWQGENPAAGVKAFKERKRERFLEGEELPAFFESLAQELNETIRDYVLVSLLTGARRTNVQEMRWTEINWQRATWTIPAQQAKGDETLSVALSPVVLRILESRKATSTQEWVFPGRGSTGHLVEPKNAWKRILKRAGLQDLRLHDLRRTLGSWQAATGASLPIIGKSLGHKSLAATQIYARLNLDPVRLAVNTATDAMLLAAGMNSAGLLKGSTNG
jgi:integrase